MLAKIKQLFSDSAAFAMALMGNKIVAFLLVPVYTRYLVPSRFGDWDMTNTIAMVVTYFCILGTDTAFAFYYFESKDEEDRKGYFTAAVFFPFVVSLFFLAVAFFISAPSVDLLYNNPEGYANLPTLAIITIVANVVIQQTLAYARFARQVKVFIIGTMTFVIGSSLASVWFLIEGKMGVLGIFYGQILVQSIVAVILLWYYRHQFTRHIKKKHVWDLLSYGFPLLPTLLAFWVMNAVSRPIIYHLVSADAAGVFGLAVRFASIIALITSAFQLAWRPFSVSIKDREDSKRIYSLLARGFLVLGTFFIMGLTFLIQPVIKLIAGKPEYYDAYPYVWMLAFGILLNTMHLIVGVGLLINKLTKTISKTFMVAAVIYLIGNLALVPFIGAWGTGAMTVLTYLYIFLSIYRKGQRAYPVDFRIGSMMIYLTLFIGVMTAITWMQVHHWPGIWLWYLAMIVLMIVAIFATGLFNKDSIKMVSALPSKLMRKR
ncbi:Membrane protein involved in the export of O-antigen and teichoic acid [Marininema mesophilum]|uniref:Membrane protein involved in the export of O-antigen and teichoic acid n=1 Tax=Marininema mesophilum TaxID=1048340 RepID=A0A1H2TFM0_9BACL|nr:oligosaccharide flippase family protein [Marininema mesophilum]SDW42746.1 Membrane protein involved in the export of O-antigen and teichoic acid [Marininema mesophilum]